MGFKRSEKRMADIELKLRAGMERNGITGKAQEDIVRSITSFALYGFPESHAASFALIAYASAYLKCHYLAAFTCAMLNNQPMGFYSPAVLIKDAQRHGLRVLPVDVTCSAWECTVVGQALPPANRRCACGTALCARTPRGCRPRHPARPRACAPSAAWTISPSASANCARTNSTAWPKSARSMRSRSSTAATPSGRRSAPSCPSVRCSPRWRKPASPLRSCR